MSISGIWGQYRGFKKEVYIIYLNYVIDNFGAFVFFILALFLKEKLQMSTREVGIYISLLALVKIPSTIVAGKLIDKYSRKFMLIFSNIVSSIIMITCGFLGNSTLIPYILILEVIISSIASPARVAMTSDLSTPENRKKVFSLMYWGKNLGSVFGFTLAGLLFEHHTNWLFWGDGITILLSAILVLFLIPESKPKESEIKSINDNQSRAREHQEEGSIYKILRKKYIVLVFAIAGTFINFASSQRTFLMPLHLSTVFGVSFGSKFFGILSGLSTIIIVSLTPVISKLTEKYSAIVCVMTGAVLYGLGFSVLIFSDYRIVFIICTIIFTIGNILVATNAGTYLSNNSPVTHRARFSSITSLIWSLGGTLSPIIIGNHVKNSSYNSGWFFLSLSAFIGVSILIYINILDTKKHSNIESSKDDKIIS